MKVAGGGATAAGLGSLGSVAFSSPADAQAASDDNSFQIDVIEGDSNAIKSDPTSASNTYADDGDLIAYQWGNTATESEGEGDGSRYLTYSGSGGSSVSSRPTFNIDFSSYTATVDVTVDSGSMDVTVVCYSAANGGTTSNPGFDPSGPQSEVDRATATGVSGSGNTFTVDIPRVNNTNQADGGYTSIQTAVDEASSGDTIEAEPATYNESVAIDKNNITLQQPSGAGSKPFIDSRGQGGPSISIDGSSGGASGVTVDGFLFNSNNDPVVNTFNMTDFTIQNCTVGVDAGTSNNGVFCDGVLTMDNVDMFGFGSGSASTGYAVKLEDGDAGSPSEIKNCLVNGFTDGMYIQNCNNAQLNNNEVRTNVANGILLQNVDNVTVDNSEIYDTFGNNNQGIKGRGVFIENSDNVTLKNSQIYDGSRSGNEDGIGIDLNDGNTYDGSTININNNNIENNSASGMFATTSGGSSLNNKIDAERNFWGADNGPSGDADGSGDGIYGTGLIDYQPWLEADGTERSSV